MMLSRTPYHSISSYIKYITHVSLNIYRLTINIMFEK
jgi:hypothetical protein